MSRVILVPEPITFVCRIPVVDEPKRIHVRSASRTSRIRIKRTRPARVSVKRPFVKRERPFQTHCKSGHELVDPNLYYPKSGRRKRECRACIRNRVLKYKAKVAQRDTN